MLTSSSAFPELLPGPSGHTQTPTIFNVQDKHRTFPASPDMMVPASRSIPTQYILFLWHRHRCHIRTWHTPLNSTKTTNVGHRLNIMIWEWRGCNVLMMDLGVRLIPLRLGLNRSRSTRGFFSDWLNSRWTWGLWERGSRWGFNISVLFWD